MIATPASPISQTAGGGGGAPEGGGGELLDIPVS